MSEHAMEERTAAMKSPARNPEPAPHIPLRAPAPAWDVGSRVPDAPSVVLAIQRAAGNQAVMRMLDAQRPGHPLTGRSTAVQRISEDDELDNDVQRAAAELHEPSDEAIRSAASEGVRTPSVPLPHLDRIQASFGRHSIAHIQAHVGPEAARASRAMNALAYASGNHVVFGATPDLRTAAHEAAHIVQQEAGVQLSGGIGRAGDPYERNADAVADAVVAGRSAEELLAPFTETSITSFARAASEEHTDGRFRGMQFTELGSDQLNIAGEELRGGGEGASDCNMVCRSRVAPNCIQAGPVPIQRFVQIAYTFAAGAVTSASATITHADIGTGSPPTVVAATIPSHVESIGLAIGAAHPYHHERGHLIGAQLGGNGSDINNLVGLSDGTNAPLMADIEGVVRDMLMAEGPGSSVWVQVEVDYAATDYAGPLPKHPRIVGKITYRVYSSAPPAPDKLLYITAYPNGVVKNHHQAGCC